MKNGQARKVAKCQPPLTWGQIKQLVEDKGVRDSDHVYFIDIGPGCREVFVAIETCADYVTPRSPQSRAARSKLAGVRAVEIGDDPDLLEIAPE